MVTASGNIACNELPAAGSYVISVFNASKSLNQSAGFELQGSGGGVLGVEALAGGTQCRSREIIGAPPVRRSVVDPIVAEEAHEHLTRMEREMEIVRRLGSPRSYRRPPRSTSAVPGMSPSAPVVRDGPLCRRRWARPLS
jgi:hypothetical protein